MKAQYTELTPSQAWYLFIENQLKPYHEKIQIMWQQFRDEELWVHDIEMIFTVNEPAIRALFKQY